MRTENALFLFLKACAGGLVAASLGWIAVLCVWTWRWSIDRKRLGLEGLGATAGGGSYLLHSPLVVAAIAVGFGIGFYLTVRMAGGAG